MNYVNTTLNITIVLLCTYVVSYIIVYLATVYDMAAKGRGSILDNVYIAKFLWLISAILYYLSYYTLLLFKNIWLYATFNNSRSFQTILLILLLLLSITILSLYMKLY